MRPFTFRAQAALELRRREHDAALRRLAEARRALAEAQSAEHQAAAEIAAADARLADALRSPRDDVSIDWYRSWRVRCVDEHRQRTDGRMQADAAVSVALQQTVKTHQRVRALEQLHEHALARWNLAVHQEEMKAMDALATTRYYRKDQTA